MTTPTRSRGLGTAQLAVMRAIADGRTTEMDMKLVLKPYAGGVSAQAILRGLRAAQFIGWHRPTDRYYLTDRGRDQLPAVQPAAVMRPYVVPVQPPRRAGSMRFTSLPSLAAGVARPYWAEGLL